MVGPPSSWSRDQEESIGRLGRGAFGRSKLARFIFDNSLLLLAGTIAAVVWANLDLGSYDRMTHPLHFWVNDVGMVFFFALAAKEVFEATLPGGPLASPRQAMAPLAAAVGGMVAPALIYVALTSTVGPAELSRGWAIPCATDIAFSAMIARVIFPSGHPAIPFLLLLAIADDALGLMILAVFYPSGPLSVAALGILMTAAVLAALWLKRRGVRSFWPYVIGPGSLSWAALYFGGFHPALALVPIVPFMPHSARDLGLFDPQRGSPGRHAQSVRALVGDAGAVRAAPLWTGECRRPVRASRTGHVLRAGRPAARQADRHPAVLWRRSTGRRESARGTPSRRPGRHRHHRGDRLYGLPLLRDGRVSGGRSSGRNEDGSASQLQCGAARARRITASEGAGRLSYNRLLPPLVVESTL